MKTGVDEDAIRIRQQFCARDAMVYDLRCRVAGRLTPRISGRGGDDDGSPTQWRIEAPTNSSPEGVVVSETGATRAEALRALGCSRNDKRRLANNLPSFDWESVARAMAAVRAI